LKSNFKLFDFNYEFNDKAMKKDIEQAIIDYYYFSEIGQETPDRFKQRFKSRFLGLIGYYNELHNTTLLEYEPLINYKMTEALKQLRETTQTTDNQGESKTTGDESTQGNESGSYDNKRTDDLQQTTDSSQKDSDYPQQPIAGGDYLSGEQTGEITQDNTGTVKDESTNQRDSTYNRDHTQKTNTEGQEQTEGTDNTEYEKTIEGITGKTYQELIQAERANILRLKGMIIQELKPCFMMVY